LLSSIIAIAIGTTWLMVLVTNCYPRTSLNNKKKPGGQPGHQGTTRKGFGRVDKFEAIRIQQCPKCGSQSLKEMDLETSLQGMLAWIGNYGHLSYKKQQEWLTEMGLVNIGTGTIAATTERVAESIKGAVEELAEWVKNQPSVHVGESF
jgi:transposase